ncbi:hypothetical protein D0Z00_001503 [Geotrichum galactomycetum]|uniref:Uncharacterized protein n=1 Tax=Geotrichum galactomycetum TaxID=27317 RepID=A0ACB6V6T3_9ASCO|nr:hypothetical protein D0Z00_001503 [Geotrichum candidum]
MATKNLLDITISEENGIEVAVVFPRVDDETQKINKGLEVLAFVDDYLSVERKEYIWHADRFKLRLAYNEAAGGYYLHGITFCKDSPDDCSFVLWIVYEISLRFFDAFVRVTDSMGELLFINASESIGERVNDDDLAPNHGWVHEGQLKRIPGSATSSVDGSFTIQDAYEYIKSGKRLIEDDKFTRAAFKESYILFSKQRWRDACFQNAKVLVPKRVAAALHTRPDLLTKALTKVHADDELDPDHFIDEVPQLKHIDTNEIVEVSVKFPKATFALTLSQKPSLYRWYMENIREKPNSTVSNYSKVLGAGITLGFELSIKEDKQIVHSTFTSIPSNRYIKTNLDEQCLFEKRLSNEVNLDNFKEAKVKEKLDRYLDGRTYTDTFNWKVFVDRVPIPSDKEMSQWSQREDSTEWFEKFMNDKPEDLDQDIESQVPGLIDKMSSQMDSSNWDDPPTDDDSDNANEKGITNDDDDIDLPDGMDEDDFFEFVLKEGLKLSAEEIEQYRSGNFTTPPTDQNAKAKAAFKPDLKGKSFKPQPESKEEEFIDDFDSDDCDFDHYGLDEDQAKFPTLEELRGFREDLAGLKSAREILDGLISETSGPSMSRR